MTRCSFLGHRALWGGNQGFNFREHYLGASFPRSIQSDSLRKRFLPGGALRLHSSEPGSCWAIWEMGIGRVLQGRGSAISGVGWVQRETHEVGKESGQRLQNKNKEIMKFGPILTKLRGTSLKCSLH